MIKKNKLSLILSSALILLPSLIGIFLWDKLPEKMTIHWGADGNPNGFSGPFTAVFILPLILLAFHWLCVLVTAKDNKGRQQGKFFSLVIWITPLISIFASSIIYAVSFDIEINMEYTLSLLFAFLFIILGNYMPKLTQNYTMGLRIKWTLQSEENWNATHRFCGKVWVICGILMLFTVLLKGSVMLIALMLLVLISVITPFIYSYLYFKKQKADNTTAFNTPENLKTPKSHKIITIIVVPIVLILVAVLMFTGNVTVDYSKNSFKVDANYWNSLTVQYDEIDSIEFRDNFNKGIRTNGMSSARLLVGIFKNEEFGNYTLYSYTNCNSAVIIEADGKILAICGKDAQSTKEIYGKLKNNMN